MGKTNDLIVAQIERLLDQAKAGEFVAFAYCASNRAGVPKCGWTMNSETVRKLIEGLSHLQTKFQENVLTCKECREAGK